MNKEEQYVKYLEMSARIAYDEYRINAMEAMKFQFDHAKTYIWISMAFVSGVVAIILNMVSGDVFVKLNVKVIFSGGALYISVFLCAISVVFALLCACVGVLSMRGTGERVLPFNDFTKFISAARKDIEAGCNGSFYEAIINNINVAYDGVVNERGVLGKKLRSMGWFITLSFGAAFFSAVCLLIM